MITVRWGGELHLYQANKVKQNIKAKCYWTNYEVIRWHGSHSTIQNKTIQDTTQRHNYCHINVQNTTYKYTATTKLSESA